MVQAGEDGIRSLLVSGKPLEEPVAWYGPIAMNTQAELRKAFEELDRARFWKSRKSPAPRHGAQKVDEISTSCFRWMMTFCSRSGAIFHTF